jgi:hypothetical protein
VAGDPVRNIREFDTAWHSRTLPGATRSIPANRAADRRSRVS